MNIDPFDQLAETAVPSPPDHFGRELHSRLNRSLLAIHFIELILGALPSTAFHFGRAVGATARFTMTGRYDRPRRPSQ